MIGEYVLCKAASVLAKEVIHHSRVRLHVKLHLPFFHNLPE